MIPWAFRAGSSVRIPIGLELYSVRDALQKDPEATVRAVADMGYECVEFYGPYYDWTEPQAKQIRKLLDDLGIRCNSTHNDEEYFSAEKIQHARNLNLILGSKYLVMASADLGNGPDRWRALADSLNAAAEQLDASGLKVGYHNHEPEFTASSGTRPIEVLAKNTKSSVMLQLDVGTCIEAGSDPVAWVNANPGRIQCMHCKDWSPELGYKAIFGQGIGKWNAIFDAAEKIGGIEYYLIEQEGSAYTPLETAEKCLAAFRKVRPA